MRDSLPWTTARMRQRKFGTSCQQDMGRQGRAICRCTPPVRLHVQGSAEGLPNYAEELFVAFQVETCISSDSAFRFGQSAFLIRPWLETGSVGRKSWRVGVPVPGSEGSRRDSAIAHLYTAYMQR